MAHTACAAEFVGAHLCHVAEYVLSNSTTSLPVEGAWMDPSIDQDNHRRVGGSFMYGRWSTGVGSCGAWTYSGTSSPVGTALLSSGEFDTGPLCDVARPVGVL